ncbi:universal stress protein [Halobacteriales archaeon QH_2_65_14]|nr:MAG: universal stress protein [Halobacteriales archaeon QH_2_65_14]
MYDEILLPTDGSPGSEAAVEHAIHTAAVNDATLHAVHVIEMTEVGDLTQDVPGTESDVEEDVQSLFVPVKNAATRADVETTTAIIEGNPPEKLIDYLEQKEIDLVVMGTHGKSGISRVLLGSTTEEVLRNTPVPILAVRA